MLGHETSKIADQLDISPDVHHVNATFPNLGGNKNKKREMLRRLYYNKLLK